MRFLYSLVFAVVVASPIRAGTLAQFRTILGTVEVELFDQDKPVTVQNFIRLTQAGYYQNVFLHRCVPGFVLQGGGFITLSQLDTNLFTHTSVYSWPNFGPITNEFSVGPRISNSYGTIAMARSAGQTNSATSQWFFNLVNNSELDNVDGGFTVFGRVVRGTNILNFFNTLSYNSGIINMTNYSSNPLMRSVFTQLPVTYFGAAHPRISDLLYVDVSLLSVEINSGSNQVREISWNSVAGKTNYVEFTTNFPPAWQVLIKTNGTGATLKITDSSTAAARRFYRVRVDY